MNNVLSEDKLTSKRKWGNKRKKKWAIFLLILISVITPLEVFAENEDKQTFFVVPMLPTNQTLEVTDFFDVKLGPNKKQVLEIEVHNESIEPKTFVAIVENSITNDNGVIEYQHETKEYDPTLKHKLTDLAKNDGAVEVKGRDIATLKVQLEMPSDEFDGIILGGIRVYEQRSDETKSKGAITNVFSYVLPVKIRQTETDIVNKLNFQGVSIGQQTFENVVKAKLQNPQPEILRELVIDANIYKAKGKTAVYKETKKNMKLAPNSNFAYSISLGKNEFKAGRYRLELTAKAKDLNKKWVEEFEITKEEAKELNDSMVFKKGSDWRLYIIIGLILLVSIIVIYLFYRQKKAKRVKRSRKKKRINKMNLLVLLLYLGVTAPVLVNAETTEDSDVSTATIKLMLPTTSESTDHTNENKKEHSKSVDHKELPKTGENNTSFFSYIGSIVLASSCIIVYKKQKGKVY